MSYPPGPGQRQGHGLKPVTIAEAQFERERVQDGGRRRRALMQDTAASDVFAGRKSSLPVNRGKKAAGRRGKWHLEGGTISTRMISKHAAENKSTTLHFLLGNTSHDHNSKQSCPPPASDEASEVVPETNNPRTSEFLYFRHGTIGVASANTIQKTEIAPKPNDVKDAADAGQSYDTIKTTFSAVSINSLGHGMIMTPGSLKTENYEDEFTRIRSKLLRLAAKALDVEVYHLLSHRSESIAMLLSRLDTRKDARMFGMDAELKSDCIKTSSSDQLGSKERHSSADNVVDLDLDCSISSNLSLFKHKGNPLNPHFQSDLLDTDRFCLSNSSLFPSYGKGHNVMSYSSPVRGINNIHDTKDTGFRPCAALSSDPPLSQWNEGSTTLTAAWQCTNHMGTGAIPDNGQDHQDNLTSDTLDAHVPWVYCELKDACGNNASSETCNYDTRLMSLDEQCMHMEDSLSCFNVLSVLNIENSRGLGSAFHLEDTDDLKIQTLKKLWSSPAYSDGCELLEMGNTRADLDISPCGDRMQDHLSCSDCLLNSSNLPDNSLEIWNWKAGHSKEERSNTVSPHFCSPCEGNYSKWGTKATRIGRTVFLESDNHKREEFITDKTLACCTVTPYLRVFANPQKDFILMRMDIEGESSERQEGLASDLDLLSNASSDLQNFCKDETCLVLTEDIPFTPLFNEHRQHDVSRTFDPVCNSRVVSMEGMLTTQPNMHYPEVGSGSCNFETGSKAKRRRDLFEGDDMSRESSCSYSWDMSCHTEKKGNEYGLDGFCTTD